VIAVFDDLQPITRGLETSDEPIAQAADACAAAHVTLIGT
jgi:hypothetical protein